MKRWIAGLAVAVLVSAGAALAAAPAHEVTYRGTVVALQTGRYAQPAGGFREVQELQVTVVDEKTKKPLNKVFAITADTRVLRAGKRITIADAAVKKGERVEVVVDHDEPGDEAIEVRLSVTG